jgi:hypothetical protein
VLTAAASVCVWADMHMRSLFQQMEADKRFFALISCNTETHKYLQAPVKLDAKGGRLLPPFPLLWHSRNVCFSMADVAVLLPRQSTTHALLDSRERRHELRRNRLR